MAKRLQLLFAALLLAQTTVSAQDDEILTWPPPGGDGYTVLQTGGAIPTGAASLYYNPALLTELEQSTGSRMSFSTSSQRVASATTGGITERVTQTFWGIAGSFPTRWKGVSLGFGFYHNAFTEDTGSNIPVLPFNEKTNVLGFAVRLGIPISIGGAIKFFNKTGDSTQSGYSPDRGVASGIGIDLGLLVRPKFYPWHQSRFRSVEIFPSAGLTWANTGIPGTSIGYEKHYFWQSDHWVEFLDEEPRSLRPSLGLQLSVLDAVDFTVGQDWVIASGGGTGGYIGRDMETHGYAVSLLGFQFAQGWLNGFDEMSMVSDRSNAIAYEFNLLKVCRVYNRIQFMNFKGSSIELDEAFPIKTYHFLGLSYRPNPRIAIGRHWKPDSNNPSDWYWGLSI